MTYNNYLPPEDDKLAGIYKVSFEIKVESQDELSLSDVTQALTEGFERGFGDGFVNKVADLSIARISKTSKQAALKIGDKIKLTSDINVEADVYSDDGYVFIGNPSEISEKLTSTPFDIEVKAGSMGFVNKINKDGSLEVADLDKPYVNDSWIELGINAVNIDLIIVKADQIEKIDAELVQQLQVMGLLLLLQLLLLNLYIILIAEFTLRWLQQIGKQILIVMKHNILLCILQIHPTFSM